MIIGSAAFLLTRRGAAAISIAAAFVGGCARPSDAPACPASFHADEARTEALIARLRSHNEGERIAARLSGRRPFVCYGDIAVASVTEGGMLLMDAHLNEAEGAARLGHLAMHVVDGVPMSGGDPSRGCEARVDEALNAEARALGLELRLRRAFGVSPPAAGRSPALAYAFEGAFWEAAPAAREAQIKAYLWEHPDGAPGVDALASGYMKRCLAEDAGR